MAASYAPWIQALPSPHHISAEYARIPSPIAYPASEDILSSLGLEILIMCTANSFRWTAAKPIVKCTGIGIAHALSCIGHTIP